MKIKSVKITGFRAFEKEEDSTFDFTSNGEIMNFASIYAPNGFGKTSFYDAVEWGVTHKIQRFDRMVDFDNVRKDNNEPLLLNKFSGSGKVIVETNTTIFENVINKRKKYNYKDKAENEYFQKQILTQDLIDAFLKEEKAEKRYENFLNIDENLKKYDAAYKKINRLLEYIKEEKKTLENNKLQEEKSLQTEIDFDQEFKKFDEINEVIRFLRKENENIDFVDQKLFNNTIYDNISRIIEIRLLTLEEELIKIKLRIDSITLARDGEGIENNLNGGILSYLENRREILKLDVHSKELDQIIKWFQQQENLNKELNLNKGEIKFEQDRLQRAFNVEKQFESFIATQTEITILEKNIQQLKSKSLVANSEKNDFKKEKNEATFKLSNLKQSLIRNQSIRNDIPAQKKQVESISLLIFDLEKKIEDLSKKIVFEEKKLSGLNVILDQYGYYENKLKDDIELLLEFNLFDGYNDLIVTCLADLKKIEDLKDKINESQTKIDNQTVFDKELKNLLNTGLELVNKSKSSHCPLCNYQYQSFEKLSLNILSNNQFNSQLKIYFEEKNNAEIELNKLEAKVSNAKEKIIKAFYELKQPYLSDHKNTQNSLSRLISERNENLHALNTNQLAIKEIYLFFGGQQTADDLSVKLEQEFKEIDKQLIDTSELFKTLDLKIVNLDLLLKTYHQNLIISENSLEELQSSKDYLQVKNFFIEKQNLNNIKKSVLLDFISTTQTIIKDLTVKIEKLNLSLSELNTKLSNHSLTKDEYMHSREMINKVKNLTLRTCETFENYIFSDFGIKLVGKDKAEIEKDFLYLIENKKDVEKLVESKKEKYKIIRILNDACIKVTESKKVKDRIETIDIDLKEFRDAMEKLIDERENIRSFLKNTIEAFFYSPLINAIYKKIDPHPDYKSMKFECDFAENKPRLQIYTSSINKKKQEVWSVPSLYFSTAQVNILSLSIFLARALKTKDDLGNSVDCIFIDDPIQSMDSINILSFIDLFRGITLSLDKQLIVSTHEENFHLLLQKKMPSELFKSKFIEFETFGVLKKIDLICSSD